MRKLSCGIKSAISALWPGSISFPAKAQWLPKIELCLRFLVPPEILFLKLTLQRLKQLPCVILASLGKPYKNGSPDETITVPDV
jgi:hypothetical protein